MSNEANFEPIRELGFAGISGTYAPIGGLTTNRIKAFCITNNTDGDLYVTTNINQNEMFVAAGSFKLYDVGSNTDNRQPLYVVGIRSQFYVKQITAPTQGTVYLECLY